MPANWRPPLPLLLSLNAGFVDAAGFLALQGLFTAHVTGNFVTLGASLVFGTTGAVAKLLALPVFCLVVIMMRPLSSALLRLNRPVMSRRIDRRRQTESQVSVRNDQAQWLSAIVPRARREVRSCYWGPSSQPCLPLGVAHLIVFRPLCSLRQADGGMPTSRVKTRVKWL